MNAFQRNGRRKSHRSALNRAAWGLSELESRLMLAGDAATAPAEAVEVLSVAQSEATDIVFVDESVDDFSDLVEGIDPSAELILLSSDRGGIEQITEILANRTNVKSVHLVAHGEEGRIVLGNQSVSEETLVQEQAKIQQWRAALTQDADVLLYSCHTGSGLSGRSFLTRLAELSGADVAASTDLTGSERGGGDWDLEASIGSINTGILISEPTRQQYQGTLDISIRAAGVTGEEQMSLIVGDIEVASWTVGGDAYGGVFETYSVDLDGVSANDVRVAFTNDFVDPESGFDRNLRVDHVSIDGVIYETEDPSVFSTGTWLPDEGVTPGFDQNEFLHTDGYFQYADTNSGTDIRIAARGNEGGESMSLIIGGETVQSWTVGQETGVYSYRADSNVSLNDVRVSFNNDIYDEANGIDRNLIVDYVELDGTRYETEAPTTFSTATWLPEDGVQPGFRQSETLHSNGYFQYAEAAAAGTEIRIAARGDEGSESMTLLIGDQAVESWTVSTEQQIYTFRADSDVQPLDIKLQFDNDALDRNIGFDRNLSIDYIELDGVRYETEAPTTFSTGTWLPADGIQPGFRLSETLHSNGYFQFAASPVSDGAGIIQFSSDSIEVNENAGVALATLVRSGGANGEVAVSFRTISGSANFDEDYYGNSGVVVFADGETEKQIALTLRNGAAQEGRESFTVELDVLDGLNLGERTSLRVDIVDDDFGSAGDVTQNARDWNLQPIHSIVLDDGRVLTVGSTDFGTQYGIWNPQTDQFNFVQNSTGTSVFADALVISPNNGNVLMTGFDPAATDPVTLVYDVSSGTIRLSQDGDSDFGTQSASASFLTFVASDPTLPDDLGPNDFFDPTDFEDPDFGA